MNLWPSDLFENYRNKRVVVLGASGFIGRWVAHYLNQIGAKLHLPVRDYESAKQTFFDYQISGEVSELDLMEFSTVEKFFEEVKPSITFNLCGYGVDRSERDPQIAERINQDLIGHLGKGLKKTSDRSWTGLNLVHVGTALEYGAINGNLSENSLSHPTTLYGQTKLAGTKLLCNICDQTNLKAVTARLFTVYGPGENQGRLLPSLIECTKTSGKIPLTNGSQRRDFIYVEDVAQGLLRLGLTDGNKYKIVNLATGKLLSVKRFVETAASLLKINAARLDFGTIPVRQEEMKHDPVTIKRLQDITKWQPAITIKEGIMQTVKFLERLNRSTVKK